MNQDWIEYKMLPIINKAVIVYSPTVGVGIARLVKFGGGQEWCWVHKRVNSTIVHNVTHWMPLPDAPRKLPNEP